MPSLPSLLTAILGLLLVAATVVGIVTTAKDSQRSSGSSQSNSGVVLYGGR